MGRVCGLTGKKTKVAALWVAKNIMRNSASIR